MLYDLSTVLCRLLGIPPADGALVPEMRGELDLGEVAVEKWLYTAEPGSRIPANLYRPKQVSGRIPAVVLTCGHGDSKGVPHMSYVAQTYARAGIACLMADPLGEEERYPDGSMGTRHHDRPEVAYRSERAGRSVMGKLIFDAMRGIDFLQTLDWIDPGRIGAAGNSLGGAVASWLFALESRLRMTIVSGWTFTDDLRDRGKHCTSVPIHKMRAVCDWQDLLELSAEHNALFVMNGDADIVIDKHSRGIVWQDTIRHLAAFDPEAGQARSWFCRGGGHRPYQGNKQALLFIHEHLGTPLMSREDIDALAELNYGEWCDRFGVGLEKLYGTELHYRGAILPDLGLTPIPRERLAVLTPDEIGSDDFTIDGWLKAQEG
ncbi:alpha/beta hydrolase [Verrucomicrobiota bacterium]